MLQVPSPTVGLSAAAGLSPRTILETTRRPDARSPKDDGDPLSDAASTTSSSSRGGAGGGGCSAMHSAWAANLTRVAAAQHQRFNAADVANQSVDTGGIDYCVPSIAVGSSVCGSLAPGPFDLTVSRRSLASCQPSILAAGLAPVKPGVLYICSHREICDEEAFVGSGIGALLCVAKELPSPFPSFASEYLDDNAMRHIQIEDNPHTRICEHIPEALQFIDEQAAEGRRTALYCQQGKSRSATIATAFLMRDKHLPASDALVWLQTVYPRAEPNLYFLEQLDAFGELQQGGLAASLRAGGQSASDELAPTSFSTETCPPDTPQMAAPRAFT